MIQTPVLLVFLFALFAAPVLAQEKPDFGRLRTERQQAAAEIDTAKSRLRESEEESRRISASTKDIESFIDRNKTSIDGAKLRLESEKRNKGSADQIQRIEREITDLEASTIRAKRDLEDKTRAVKSVDESRTTIRNAESKLADIETKISEMLARDVVAQNFKSQISGYFAAVVALMIILFFGIAFYDPVVRNNIFSGQSGIQFVTLFSLIISIILFGITGILGDKELSALLGGLSGYILGKYNATDQSTKNAPVVDGKQNPKQEDKTLPVAVGVAKTVIAQDPGERR